jgi:hypothetical protein
MAPGTGKRCGDGWIPQDHVCGGRETPTSLNSRRRQDDSKPSRTPTSLNSKKRNPTKQQKPLNARTRAIAGGDDATDEQLEEFYAKRRDVESEVFTQLKNSENDKTDAAWQERQAKLQELKGQINKLYSPGEQAFLGQLIQVFAFNHGANKDPSAIAAEVEKLHSSMEGVEETLSNSLPYITSLLKEVPEVSTTIEFSEIQEASKGAAKGNGIIAAYTQQIEGLKELTQQISLNPAVNQADYDAYYDAIESAFGGLTETIKEAKTTVTGNASLDQMLSKIASVSRERLPGYRMAVPSSIESIAARAETEPCPP